jgi:O-antigen/teichoic acid export membrane protein
MAFGGLTREVFKHAAIYSLATVLGRLISFVMLPFYAHIFHAEGYGVIGMIDATLGILVIVFAQGFHLAAMRIYHQEKGDRKLLVIGTTVYLAGGLALVAIVLPLIFSVQLSRIFLGSEAHAILLVLSLITFVIDTVCHGATTALFISQRSIAYSSIALVRLVLGLALNLVLVIVLGVGLIGIFITSLVTGLVACAMTLWLVTKEHQLRYDREIAGRLLRFQGPLLPGDLIAFASRQAERFLVRFLVDIRAVGVLEMAYKFPPLLNLFVSIPFSQAWRTKSLEIAEVDANAPAILGKMFTKYLFLMVFAGVVLAVVIESLLHILTPPEFWGAARIARIEVVTTILASANTMLAFGLMYRNKTGVISVIRSLLAVAKIPLAFIMIAKFGLQGAAYAALIIEVVLTYLLWSRSQSSYRIDYEYGKLAFIAVYGLSVAFVLTHFGVLDVIDFRSIADGAFDSWKGSTDQQVGKWLRILQERERSIVELTVDLASCVLFLAVMPWLFDLRGAWRQVSRRASRA